jgi:hypothetical protein
MTGLPKADERRLMMKHALKGDGLMAGKRAE